MSAKDATPAASTRRAFAKLGTGLKWAAVALGLFLAGNARAASPAKGTGLELRFGLGVAMTRAIPDLKLSEEIALPSREIVTGTLPSAGGYRSFGGFVDTTAVVRPRGHRTAHQ